MVMAKHRHGFGPLYLLHLIFLSKPSNPAKFKNIVALFIHNLFAMNKTQTPVLDKKQIGQKINRIAWQIYEDNFSEKEIIIAGIAKTGFLLAQRIGAVLEKISPLKIKLVKIILDKDNPLTCTVE